MRIFRSKLELEIAKTIKTNKSVSVQFIKMVKGKEGDLFHLLFGKTFDTIPPGKFLAKNMEITRIVRWIRKGLKVKWQCIDRENWNSLKEVTILFLKDWFGTNLIFINDPTTNNGSVQMKFVDDNSKRHFQYWGILEHHARTIGWPWEME